VRLSRDGEKRLREVSLAKSSSDTAVCRSSQSGHDISSKPFRNSPLTAFHAWRTCSCEGMAACDLSDWRRRRHRTRMKPSPSPNSGSIASCMAVRCPTNKQPVPTRRYFRKTPSDERSPKSLSAPRFAPSTPSTQEPHKNLRLPCLHLLSTTPCHLYFGKVLPNTRAPLSICSSIVGAHRLSLVYFAFG